MEQDTSLKLFSDKEQLNEFDFINPANQVQDLVRKISNNEDTTPIDMEKLVIPIFYYKDRIYERIRFRSLQKWEGYIIGINLDDKTFTARLIDLMNNENVEEAEFFIEEIEPEDRELIEIGAVFYWNIGYYEAPDGRHRTSLIRFRRLPGWREQDIQNAKKVADDISSQLNW